MRTRLWGLGWVVVLGAGLVAACSSNDSGGASAANGKGHGGGAGVDAGTLFDAAVPDHRTTGYASDADRGIALPGDSPWVTMYGATPIAGDTLNEQLAQVGHALKMVPAVARHPDLPDRLPGRQLPGPGARTRLAD